MAWAEIALPVSRLVRTLYTNPPASWVLRGRMAKKSSIAAQIEKLREELRRHEYLYYVLTSRKFPTLNSTG